LREDEQSDIVSFGLYTFDVEVEFIPYNRDVVRSQTLQIMYVSVEDYGVDESNTQH
jgi:hypothetical protein